MIDKIVLNFRKKFKLFIDENTTRIWRSPINPASNRSYYNASLSEKFHKNEDERVSDIKIMLGDRDIIQREINRLLKDLKNQNLP